jgi:cardiolipin synthase
MSRDKSAKSVRPNASGGSIVTPANVLTAIRLLLIPLLVCTIIGAQWPMAAITITLAIATDVYDGKLARHYDSASPLGGFFDHGTDALLVSSSAWALAQTGLIHPWLWPFIGLAFAQYALDSKILLGRVLRTSKLGKYNGIGYYALACTAIGSQTLAVLFQTPLQHWPLLQQSLQWLDRGVALAAWLLLASTILSMGERGIHLLRTDPQDH